MAINQTIKIIIMYQSFLKKSDIFIIICVKYGSSVQVVLKLSVILGIINTIMKVTIENVKNSNING
jgi:hypothetical protein